MNKPKIIFVLGFPRSGTKLLMKLLQTHNKIGGVNYEINLAHRLNKNNYGVEGFLTAVKSSTLITKIPKKTLEKFTTSITNHQNQTEIFKELLIAISNDNQFTYIVDKSPRYINYLPELLENFPEAKFIHIVRNPIDVALSHRKVWNKSIIRTSDQWRKVNHILLNHKYNAHILRIRYENLTTEPEKSLLAISRYLNISNDFDYKNVDSREKYGNVTVQGVKINKNSRLLSIRDQKLIEEYSYSAMKAFEYQISYAKKQKKKTLFLSIFLIIWDNINVLFFHIREKGIIKGTRYYLKLKNN